MQRAYVLILLWTLAACRSEPSETPAGAVRHFLEVMERSSSDETALTEAYGLLDQAAQRALAARATRARALSGQPYAPWQMLAPGRFRLRFARRALHERIEGERAVVIVTGANAQERAEVPLVREQGRWRIQLVLPAMRSDAAAGRQSDG